MDELQCIKTEIDWQLSKLKIENPRSCFSRIALSTYKNCEKSRMLDLFSWGIFNVKKVFLQLCPACLVLLCFFE